jgi:predicted amidohydrolase YtcJ
MLRLVWTAVNRVTRSDEVLGPQQRISVLDALKGITLYAAYQNFEEEIKGSIEPGKLADLVILSKNPLNVDPMTIVDIQVLATIKEGERVYQ